MFLNTVNHLGLQEDTHYCPNATCWCVNCQFICMQKVHQFPVCFIYEESLQIQNTGPNAFDVSTVSISVSKRCTFGLFPACFIYEESMYARHVNLFQCCCCVNCQHICKHVPRILKSHTMANHNKSFHAIPDHEFGAPRCKTYNQSVDGGYDQSKNWKVGALWPLSFWKVGALRPLSFWEVGALRPSSLRKVGRS